MTKKIFIALLIAAILSGLYAIMSFADVYVIYDKKSKEIYTMSPQDDTIILAGQEKVSLPGTFADYEFQANPTDYKYDNGRFILNIKKINDRVEKQRKKDEAKAKEAKIQEKIRAMAIRELELELEIEEGGEDDVPPAL